MKEQCQTGPTEIDLASEMIRFVARTSAQCFIGVDLSEDFFETLMEFTHLLNRIVVMTYFIPKQILKLTIGLVLDQYRYKMTKALQPTIKLYRDNTKFNESMVFRKSVDMGLTDQQIGDVVVCLLYVSSENTALGLTNSLIDILQHPDYITKLQSETRSDIQNGDAMSLFANDLLNSCVMESARMGTHIFPLNRQSHRTNFKLGDYYVGDIQSIALCEPALMKMEDCSATELFDNPANYYPERFIAGPHNNHKPVSTGSRTVMTWGAGSHLCTGKNFAIYEIKTALAMILNTFEIDLKNVSSHNYFSPSAFAERTAQVSIKPLDDPVDLREVKRETIKIDNHESVIERFEIDGNKVIVVRDYLTPHQQK